MKQTIITITGASGTGKSTLERALAKQFGYKPSISFTTRSKRSGEVDGVDYHFVSHEQAEELVEAGKTLEHFYFNGQVYGVLADEIENSDVPVIAVVEPNGLKQIKEYCVKKGVKHVCIVLENSLDILISRFLSRYKESGIDAKDMDSFSLRLNSLVSKEVNWPGLINDLIMAPDLCCRYDHDNELTVNDLIHRIVENEEGA